MSGYPCIGYFGGGIWEKASTESEMSPSLCVRDTPLSHSAIVARFTKRHTLDCRLGVPAVKFRQVAAEDKKNAKFPKKDQKRVDMRQKVFYVLQNAKGIVAIDNIEMLVV